MFLVNIKKYKNLKKKNCFVNAEYLQYYYYKINLFKRSIDHCNLWKQHQYNVSLAIFWNNDKKPVVLYYFLD